MKTGISTSIELNKILSMLAEYTGTEMVHKKALELVPFEDERMIREALTETAEGVSVILCKGVMPISSIKDIREVLEMARKGRILSIKDLIYIRSGLKNARELKTFLSSDITNINHIKEISDLIEVLLELENSLCKNIISENEISDFASHELAEIRRGIREKNEKIRLKLAGYAVADSKYMQEGLVTVRNGRYVIPVKKEYVSQVRGIIQDRSSSGATIFIEPQAIVDLNNDLRQLKIDEEIEINRILSKYTDEVARNYYSILNNQDLVEKLDLINAKSRLAISMEAICPDVNTDGRINIISGRHPLIKSDEVVPIDLSLGDKFTSLLITGPNTGGKTVTIKTIGLFSLMIKCGLHIPCNEGSEIAIFKDIFADIGDEQSIEQSLSTFSSHMKKIVNILNNASGDSLVLLDELGAGTDPAEGAALGISILEALKDKGAKIVATTHYTELKKYAIETDFVENASMEFDIETLSPTYKLRLGLPGKSNAFEISKRLGINPLVIENAKKILDANELDFENAVNLIEKNKIDSEHELKEAEELRYKAEERLRSADIEINKIEEKRKKIIEKAKIEALEIIRDAKKSGDEIIKELKKEKDNYSNNSSADIIKIANNARDEFKKLEKKNKIEEQTTDISSIKRLTRDTAQVGMRVKALNINQNGLIESISDDGRKAKIKIGSLNMDIDLSDLISIEDNKSKKKDKKRSGYVSARKIYKDKTRNINSEINVIGKNLDDAIQIVEKYLDDSTMAGLSKITIIHGRGEGILRDGIRKFLGTNGQVKSFTKASYDNGGDGATVVILKE